MISLTSNLDEVIGRVTRLKEERIPAVMTSALAPLVWKEAVLAAARRTLEALAQPGQEKFVELFVREAYVTVMEGTEPRLGGLVMGMRTPDSQISTAATQLTLGGKMADGGLSDGQKFAEMNVPESAMIELEQKLVDWVDTEKRWDVTRDGEKTAANIYAKAQWIMRLLLAPPGALSKRSESGGQRSEGRGQRSESGAEPRPGGQRSEVEQMSETEARESLMPVVLDYIAAENKERGQQASLDAQTAGIWLRAVLATWSALVRDSYRNQVVLELRK